MHTNNLALTAVFPGTFDPASLGHWDLILRAHKLFSHLIIAVANSPQKKTMFSLEERINMLKLQVEKSNLSSVSVEGFSNLLPNFLKQKNAQVLIRGVRTVGDYDYEMQLTGMYRMVIPELEIVMLPANPNIACISSTLIRDVLNHQGDISSFVPHYIAEYITTHKIH